jgi:hypothetical protein
VLAVPPEIAHARISQIVAERTQISHIAEVHHSVWLYEFGQECFWAHISYVLDEDKTLETVASDDAAIEALCYQVGGSEEWACLVERTTWSKIQLPADDALGCAK